jgi:hypothetical protein
MVWRWLFGPRFLRKALTTTVTLRCERDLFGGASLEGRRPARCPSSFEAREECGHLRMTARGLRMTARGLCSYHAAAAITPPSASPG